MTIHTATTLEHWDRFKRLVDAGALVAVNHSGGKDSQAMYAVVKSLVPASQIVVVHADLGDDVEHLGVQDHIRATVDHKVHVTEAVWKDGSRKTLLDAIRRRGSWPSSAARYCTSDLKRGPANKVIRRLAEERGATVVVSCFGFRAAESTARAKRPTWSTDQKNTNGRRAWFEFSPIHDLSTQDVFDLIASVGQEPHPVYAEGNERLSCVFCVLGSANDLRNGARLRPELAREYIALEEEMGHSFRHKQSLRDIVGDLVLDQDQDQDQDHKFRADVAFARDNYEEFGSLTAMIRYVAALNPELTRGQFLDLAASVGWNRATASKQFGISRKAQRDADRG